ncbi:MAG: cytochrome d ubiquinol oxidase subunit II, partial [Jiangellaceae bacterium]
MELSTLWFVLVAVLWTGYLTLEGFDFGVGILTKGLARGEKERRVLINTIGPVWDGNEVWMITAVGATFAAFPEWYATAWSAYYIPLVVILFALICRGLAFEYRAKHDSDSWRRRWDRVIFWGSLVPIFLWGVLLSGFAKGLPLDANHDFVGGLGDIVTPYTLLGGIVTTVLAVLHGAHYIGLKTVGDIRLRARRLATRLVAPAGVVTAG